MKDVGIVVVTYNRLQLLQEVVFALREQSYQNSQIVVVNNGSTDNTKEWLEQQDDIISITQENVGGAGGFYTGMKYVAENGYRYCWIMDDDVICKPTALQELVDAHNVKEGIGFLCSKVESIDGSPMNTPTVDESPSNNGYANYYQFIDKQMIKVRMATFVSVFLSCKIIFELGLPYKEYYIWGDDSEYTCRISSKYDSYMVCKSIVVHKRIIQQNLSFDTETDTSRLKNYFYKFRNAAHIEFMHLSSVKKMIYIIRMLKESIRYCFKGNFSKSTIIIKAMLAVINFNPSIQYPTSK